MQYSHCQWAVGHCMHASPALWVLWAAISLPSLRGGRRRCAERNFLTICPTADHLCVLVQGLCSRHSRSCFSARARATALPAFWDEAEHPAGHWAKLHAGVALCWACVRKPWHCSVHVALGCTAPCILLCLCSCPAQWQSEGTVSAARRCLAIYSPQS
jgi:hypothetical protein